MRPSHVHLSGGICERRGQEWGGIEERDWKGGERGLEGEWRRGGGLDPVHSSVMQYNFVLLCGAACCGVLLCVAVCCSVS